MNNIGIIGCNCREHAIGKSLYGNVIPGVNIYYIGNHVNIGLDALGYTYDDIDTTDPNQILIWCRKYNIDFVIIGPENPLEIGVADLLEKESISCFGPIKNLARLETDKLFCRNFLKSVEKIYGVTINPIFFTYTEDKLQELESNNIEYVVKQVGLASGKGVYVMGDHFKTYQEGKDLCLKLKSQNIDFIIEEKLYGEEFSLFSITDGQSISHCPPIQDYKRAFDNNLGPNTGGMGCVMNHLPFLNDIDIEEAEEINRMVLDKINGEQQEKNQIGYKGVLYGSFIKTKDGLRIIEYNCRFGDPEAIALFQSMKTNFYKVCLQIKFQDLEEIEFNTEPILTKYIACEGYPIDPLVNFEFYVNKINNANITWGNCFKKDGHFIQLGSRIFAYSLSGKNMPSLKETINYELNKVGGRVYFRKDIGSICLEKYEECGVNINLGNQIVKEIQIFIKNTENTSVLSTSGSFNGMIEYKNTILVSSMDGVGTKSIFVKDILGVPGFVSLGQDLVNHCIDDILVSGAQPLFFLDYFASSKLKKEEVVNFVKGISIACQKSNVILAGGETAEMPNVYKGDHCDLVGTIVGTIDKHKIIDGKKNIKTGDMIIGLESNGLHTNGYSLIRKLMEIAKIKNKMPSQQVLDILCLPHKCYLEDINALQKIIKINGLCHITGGGLIDNPPRILPKGLSLDLDNSKLCKGELYEWIKSLDYIGHDELLKVLNCGFGMLVIISPQEWNKISGQNYTLLGKVKESF